MASGEKCNSLSYCHVPSTKPYLYQTVPERLEQWAVSQPEKPALIVRHPDSKREDINYGQLFSDVSKVARHLVHLGIQREDRVALAAHNSVAWLLAEFGVVATGAVAVNLIMSDAIDCLRNAASIGCAAIILDTPNVKSKEEFDNLVTALDNERGPLMVILIDDDYTSERYTNFKTWLGPDSDNDKPDTNIASNIDPEDVCIMLPTSGTTGKSKYVQHTHRAFISGAHSMTKAFGIEATDVVFNDRHMGHAGGFPWSLLSDGSTIVYVDTVSTVTDQHTSFIVDVMREEGVTAGPFPPYLLFDLQKVKELGIVPPFLRSCATGGQMITKSMMNQYKEFAQVPYYVYAMTEIIGAFFLPYVRPMGEKESLGGFPTEGVEVKIVGDDELLVPFGEEGEICLRVPDATLPYVLSDGSIAESADRKGWYHTGDVGILRSDGYLVVRGRKKDMIKRAMMKIFPATIEEELRKQPDIDRVVVLAVPDSRLFEEVCACVVPRPDRLLTTAMLRDFSLAVFNPSSAVDGKGHMPGYFLIVEEMPMLASGKPDKLRLVEMAKATFGL